MTTETISIPTDDPPALSGRVYRASDDRAPAFVLAHGAGAGQQSAFIVDFATALAALGVTTLTFNFRYIDQRRKAPDRPDVLEACYRAVVGYAKTLGTGGLFIGGKSMGGRIATQIAAADSELPIRGLALLGYPLHPPGRPQQMRDKHLPEVKRPALFVQGSKDTFGTPAELAPVLARMSPRPDLHGVEGGDHSFKVSRNVERQQATIRGIQQTVAGWILTRRAG